MKKHLIDFPEDNISIESFYDRLRPCYDSIMQFSDRVLVAQMNWNGMLEGAVYGFVEDPEEGWSPIECRLELLKISDETYTDAGHAIEWCIKNAHCKRAELLRGLLLVVADFSSVEIHINPTKRGVYDRAA